VINGEPNPTWTGSWQIETAIVPPMQKDSGLETVRALKYSRMAFVASATKVLPDHAVHRDLPRSGRTTPCQSKIRQ